MQYRNIASGINPVTSAVSWLCAVCLLLLLAAGPSAAGSKQALAVREMPDKSIMVENAFYRLELVPEQGARIKSLIVKPSGDNLVYWNETACLGGLLDNKGIWPSVSFKPETLERSSGVYKIRLSGEYNGLKVVKTFTFYAHTPMFSSRSNFENLAQREFNSEPPVFVRNFLKPGGANITDDDTYFLPMSEGVIAANEAGLRGHPDMAGKIDTNIVAGWQAFLNRNKRQGMVIVYPDDALRGFYQWAETKELPTWEWTYRSLPVGHFLETDLLMLPVHGLTGVRYAGPKIIVNPVSDDQSFRVEAMAVNRELAHVSLKVRDLDAGGKSLQEYPAIKLGSLPAGRVVSVTAPALPVPSPARIREYSISSGKYLIAVFQDALLQDNKSVSGLIKPMKQPPARFGAIKGWQAEKPFAPVINDAGKKRGYALYSREGQDAGAPLHQLRFDLAPELRESLIIGLWPVRSLGNTQVELLPDRATDSEWLKSHVIVRYQKEVPPPPNKGGVTYSFYQLRNLEGWSPAVSADNRLWLTLRGKGLQPGTYTFKVKVIPAEGEPAVIPAEVKVWPVKLAERTRINLEQEHLLTLLPGCDYRGGWSEATGEALDSYTRNMAEHGVTHAQLYPLTGPAWNYIKVKSTGKPLSQSLQENKGLFEKDPMPELDFSYFNPWLDTARKNGLYRFSTNIGTVANVPIDALRLKKWFWGEAYRWVISRGYQPQDVFMKIWDEVPVDRIPAWCREAGLMQETGWRVFCTYGSIFRYPELTRSIDAVQDMWQFGGWNPEEYLARRQAGDLGNGDEMWLYDGWATAGRNYQAMRCRPWEVAFSRLDGFHGHEYYRWQDLAVGAIVTIENNRPVDSPAWEGLSDGISDARILAELLHTIDKGRNLRGIPADRQAPAAAVIEGIIGSARGAILPMKVVPGEYGTRNISVVDPENLAGTARYRQARRALLEKLAELQGLVK